MMIDDDDDDDDDEGDDDDDDDDVAGAPTEPHLRPFPEFPPVNPPSSAFLRFVEVSFQIVFANSSSQVATGRYSDHCVVLRATHSESCPKNCRPSNTSPFLKKVAGKRRKMDRKMGNMMNMFHLLEHPEPQFDR